MGNEYGQGVYLSAPTGSWEGEIFNMDTDVCNMEPGYNVSTTIYRTLQFKNGAGNWVDDGQMINYTRTDEHGFLGPSDWDLPQFIQPCYYKPVSLPRNLFRYHIHIVDTPSAGGGTTQTLDGYSMAATLHCYAVNPN